MPNVTGPDATAKTEKEAAVELFASLLRTEFGERSVRVAEMQVNAAYGEMKAVWANILSRLRQ